MGKATILQSLGAGQYRIKVEFDNAQIEARKTAIDDETRALTTELSEITPKKQAALDKFNADMAAVDDCINAMTPEDYHDIKILVELQTKAFQSKFEYDALAGQEKRIKLKIMGMVKDLFYLEKYCPKEFEANAWCVAYKEDLSGTLKSIEIDYLMERDVITDFPRNDTGFWLPETVQAPDSQLKHPLALSVHAVWFNLAMYPAAQRDKGRYRIATITGLDKTADKCDLTFEGHYTFQDVSTLADDQIVFPLFDGNGAQQQNYSGADIVYMTCNAEAFEVGDKVIVDLHGGVGVPTVIGFYDNPRQCPIIPPPVNWIYREILGRDPDSHLPNLNLGWRHHLGPDPYFGVESNVTSINGDIYYFEPFSYLQIAHEDESFWYNGVPDWSTYAALWTDERDFVISLGRWDRYGFSSIDCTRLLDGQLENLYYNPRLSSPWVFHARGYDAGKYYPRISPYSSGMYI